MPAQYQLYQTISDSDYNCISRIARAVAFSSDQKTFAMAIDNNSTQYNIVIFVRDNDGYWKCSQVLDGHTYLIQSIDLSPDGKTLVSGSWDRTIKIWKLGDGDQWRCTQTFHVNNGGHDEWVHLVKFSPDEKTMISGSRWLIKMWVLSVNNDWIHLQDIPCEYKESSVLKFSCDSKKFAFTSGCRVIFFYFDGAKWTIMQSLNHYKGLNSPIISSLALSPDGGGQILATASWDKTVKIWMLNNEGQWKNTQTFELDDVGDTSHEHFATEIAFSLDGKMIACGSNKGITKLYSLGDDGLWYDVSVIDEESSYHTNRVTSLAFSSDGYSLVSGLSNGSIKVFMFDGRNWCYGQTLDQGSSYVKELKFLCDEQSFISISLGGVIKNWKKFPNHDQEVNQEPLRDTFDSHESNFWQPFSFSYS